jgi:hypothetical protein
MVGRESTSGVLRPYRQHFGHYRVCYELALSRAPELEGYWVARIAQDGQGGICSVETVASTLPDEMSTCLRERTTKMRVGPEAGQLEFAITFHP